MELNISLRWMSGILVATSATLISTASAQTSEMYLMAGDQAERLEVQPGATRNGSTEVTGLSDGDLVIIREDSDGDGVYEKEYRLQRKAVVR